MGRGIRVARAVGRAVVLCWLALPCLATVVDADRGRDSTLAALAVPGKWTVLMFWSVDCTICEAEMPEYAELARSDADIAVVGISVDGEARAEAVRSELERHGASFPNHLTDPFRLEPEYSARAGEPFRGTPTFWLLSPEGLLVGMNTGPMRVSALRAFIARKARAR